MNKCFTGMLNIFHKKLHLCKLYFSSSLISPCAVKLDLFIFHFSGDLQPSISTLLQVHYLSIFRQCEFPLHLDAHGKDDGAEPESTLGSLHWNKALPSPKVMMIPCHSQNVSWEVCYIGNPESHSQWFYVLDPGGKGTTFKLLNPRI